VLRLLERTGLSLWDDALDERDADGRKRVLGGLREFREHLGGQLHVTLLRGIGDGFDVHEMDEGVLATALERLERRARVGAGLGTLRKSAS
jgi:3-dehydroquinate synthase